MNTKIDTTNQTPDPVVDTSEDPGADEASNQEAPEQHDIVVDNYYYEDADDFLNNVAKSLPGIQFGTKQTNPNDPFSGRESDVSVYDGDRDKFYAADNVSPGSSAFAAKLNGSYGDSIKETTTHSFEPNSSLNDSNANGNYNIESSTNIEKSSEFSVGLEMHHKHDSPDHDATSMISLDVNYSTMSDKIDKYNADPQQHATAIQVSVNVSMKDATLGNLGGALADNFSAIGGGLKSVLGMD